MDDNAVEIEFRDGKRLVPLYLAAVIESIEPYRYTYDEAVAEANKQMVRDKLTGAIDKVILGHFMGMR